MINDYSIKIIVVIAAFNEESTINKTIINLREVVKDIVVVDDYSSDQTSSVSIAAGATTLRHAVNLGQGAALQTGIEFALSRGATHVVTFDADGQHDSEQILPMLNSLLKSGKMIAIGSRFLGKTINLPLHRKIILKAAILFTRFTGGGNFTDVHNGFRILTRDFCRDFEFKQNRMAHASEILSYISHNKIPFIEFPVTIKYTDYSLAKGQKSSNAFRVLIELFVGRFTK